MANIVGGSGNNTLTGTSGNDTIDGGGGNDTIYGQGGGDILAGNTGADTIDGGDGNDTIYSDASGTMDHGTEVDTITGGDGSDTIYAGYGDNVDGGADGVFGDKLYISFQGAPAGISFDFNHATQTIGGGTITGIESVSSVEGSNYDDYINLNTSTYSAYSDLAHLFGMGGNDTIIGGYYTSLIDGGDGNDILDGTHSQYLSEIDGGAGDDIIYANTAENLAVTNGGSGNDTIYSNYQAHGGDGNDTIYLSGGYYGVSASGDAGDDTIFGGNTSDNVQGNDGNDTIHGGAGDDTLDGGAGADIIEGGLGKDTLIGGAGNDIFEFGQADGKDTITDFTNGDVVQINGYDSAQSITQNGSDVAVVLSSDDQITFQNTDVATVQAGLEFMPATDDVLTGTDGQDYLRGYGGNDTISGLGADDVLAGGSGADTLDGGDGNDVLYSGDVVPWNFSFPYQGQYIAPHLDNGTEHDTLIGGNGDDIFFAGYGDSVDGGASDSGDTLYISFQGATSGVHFDGHLETQTIGGGTISGIENISWVQGSNYDDYIDVGTGRETGYNDFGVIQGFGGDDTLIAGYYTAVLDGGDGNDTLDGSPSAYLQEIDGGAGNDTITGASNGDAPIYGGDGNDLIHAQGEVHGGAGDDTIYVAMPYFDSDDITGDDGKDTIIGSDAGDHIDGGAGNDAIDGGGGDDVLRSGSGDNILTGGTGNDYFIVGDGNNVITDFSAGDKMGIQASFAGSAIAQVGGDVVITLDDGNQLTLKNTDTATVQAALESSVKLNDVKISPDGSTIYGAGDDGTLYAYDAASGHLIHAWHVGTELGGMDISPDGTFAVVTNLQPLSSSEDPSNWTNDQSTAAVYNVDLSTGHVTTYTTTLTGAEYAFYDASILDNGQVLLTEQIHPGWSGWVSMRTLDLSTGQFSAGTAIDQYSVLTDSLDRSTILVAESNSSNAPLEIYKPAQGFIADNSGSNVYGYNGGVEAYSAEGGLIAQALYNGGIDIYNSQLQLKTNLATLYPQWNSGSVSGLAFDRSGQLLFVLDGQTGTIVALSTSDWSKVGEYTVGASITSNSGSFGDQLLVAPDDSYFIVQSASGGFIRVDATPSPTGGADTLLGTSGSDTINGLGGDDLIHGMAGDDTLTGGDGNDTISGGTGDDTLTGGAGNDTFLYGMGDGSDTITDFTSGDIVKLSGYTSAQSITQVGSDVTVVFASGDQITFDNTTVSVVEAGLQFAAEPPKTLVGTGGNNTLIGGTGDDHLSGLGGNDVLNGGPGSDTMVGGAGNDTYYVDSVGDVVTELAGQGTDTVHSAISYALPVNVEKGVLDGTSSLSLTGNNLANTLTGNSGDDFLYGMAGADKIIGGAGNDVLDGGAGNDLLTGGTGADTFEFASSPGNDRITDFVSGTDKLDFHLLDSVTATNVKTSLSNGNTIVSVDVNHDHRTDFTVTLVGVTHVSASDYIFHA